jgi:RES domain-containing protein
LKITAWRVVKNEYAANAFDGEGARLFGGRWHSIGRAVIYTSATTSLGLLEQMVHAESAVLPFYAIFPVTFGSDLVETIDPVGLPQSWRSSPPPFELQRIGDKWAGSTRSCILEVPSVIVPHESIFMLNPNHPDFATVEIGEPISLDIDHRLA